MANDVNMQSWKKVSSDEAQKNPLYGVGGWLIVFAIGVLFGFFLEISSLQSEAANASKSISEFLSIDYPAITFSKSALILESAVAAVIYWLLFTKHPKFRLISTCVLLGEYPVLGIVGLLNPFDYFGHVMAASLVPWTISCCVWVTYLNTSKRVRITVIPPLLTTRQSRGLMIAD